jgi:hypothetical protein
MTLSKADIALLIGLLGLLASLGLNPTLLLASLASFLIGKAIR